MDTNKIYDKVVDLMIKDYGWDRIKEIDNINKHYLNDIINATEDVVLSEPTTETDTSKKETELIPVVGGMLFFTLDQDEELTSLHATHVGAIEKRKEMLKCGYVDKCTVNEMLLEE